MRAFIPALYLLLTAWQILSPSHAFAPLTKPAAAAAARQFSSLTSSQEPDPLEEMSDERKANLFQFLLRDLEVEEVPLLGVDASEAHVFQAALWTTMAELSENDVEGKACLIFEAISIPTLQAFVEQFDGWKRNSDMMAVLPEFQRFNVTLVGRGVGPAIVLSTYNRTDTQQEVYQEMKQSAPVPDEIRWNAAIKTFFARTSSSSSNLDGAAYRIIASADACDILSGYWTSICELLAESEEQMSSLILTYPPSVNDSEDEQQQRYNAIAQLMDQTVSLNSDVSSVVSNVHFQPFYDRDAVPLGTDGKPSKGHLPPSSSMQSEVSEEVLRLENYQRRSPLPGVILQRADGDIQYEAASSLASQTEEELVEALKKESEIIALSTPKFQ